MAIQVVNLSDSFDSWRQKDNTTAVAVGDIASLSTTDKTSTVAAINEVQSTTASTGFSIAMAIALG
jgi:hypothetical protein